MEVIIKNGIVATAADTFAGDLLIEDGLIKAIGPDLARSGAELIDAKQHYVMPGGVDVHTHFNLDIGIAKAQDDFFTGTRAAAFGGTTCIVDHPGFGPTGCELDYMIKQYQRDAEGQAVIDYGFHGVFQQVHDGILARIHGLVREGVPSFKAYLTYDYKLEDADLLAVLRELKKSSGLLAVHAEDDAVIQALRKQFSAAGKTAPIQQAESRPDFCEAEAIARVLDLARMAGPAPVYIVHLSTALGLEKIRRARRKGQTVLVETCPQYLLLDDSCYAEADFGGLKYIMAPPLRKPADQTTLWQALREGEIDVIATDHCPFDFSLKLKLGKEDFSRCPGGIAGVETRIPLMFSEGVAKKRIDLKRFVDLISTRPARIMGLYPRKGDLRPGSDADIVILDPKRQVTITHALLHHNVDYTPFEGWKVKGWPVLTMARGKVVVKDDTFLGEKGFGQFIRRKPYE